MSPLYFLPDNMEIDVNKLASVFQKKSASYKYLWFISLLQLINEKMGFFTLHELAAKMIANAWYPVNHCHLNLGAKDQMASVIERLVKRYGFERNQASEDVEKEILRLGPLMQKDCQKVVSEVPYHFLTPWLGYYDGKQHHRIYQELSNDLSKNCPYKIIEVKGQSGILIPKHWEIYFQNYYPILLDFAYFNFATYLQNRNPEVPGILYKMVKSKERDSLKEQTKFWKTFLEEKGGVRSIYTGEVLHANDQFALDHFIPWSYVAHNQIWNLAPIENSINSKKSNKLPSIGLIRALSDVQYELFSFYTQFHKNNQLIDDYSGLGYSVQELTLMPEETFKDVFVRKVKLVRESASRLGFSNWNDC